MTTSEYNEYSADKHQSTYIEIKILNSFSP